MTETEWLACADPRPMLEFLLEKASDRKLRLFACACCQRISHRLTDERCRLALDVGVRHADGLLSREELFTINRDANLAAAELRRTTEEELLVSTSDVEVSGVYAAAAASHLLGEPASSRADCVGACVAKALGAMPASRWSHHNFADGIRLEEMGNQASLLREICGNPFHPLTVPLFVLAWNDGTVVKLAQGIYYDQAFDRLPILADALEESGCTNADILNRCRQPGEHVRGCWVVDLILGKG
jgi:hypothetical protein